MGLFCLKSKCFYYIFLWLMLLLVYKTYFSYFSKMAAKTRPAIGCSRQFCSDQGVLLLGGQIKILGRFFRTSNFGSIHLKGQSKYQKAFNYHRMPQNTNGTTPFSSVSFDLLICDLVRLFFVRQHFCLWRQICDLHHAKLP